MIPDTFGLYLTAAIILAITPGPGIFYVLTRSIKGGRREGYASSVGTAVGGLFHVLAAALGLSAILATSAVAFHLIKYAGAAYLIYLGLKTLLATETNFTAAVDTGGRVFRQGVLTEILNPKTALFFLAFIPQFIDPTQPVVPQFVFLGCISVALNTAADLVVASMAGTISQQLQRRAWLRRGQRWFAGGGLVALGVYVGLADS